MLTTIRRLALPLLVFLAWTPVANAWSWPVEGPVLQPFAYDEAHPYASGQHRGIDIGADAAGETVVAPAAGTVSFAGSVPTSGKSITIDTADGYAVTLTHLGSLGVAKGSQVAEQDPVGTIGPSGTPEVDGPYLHLGIRVAADPNGYVDPLGLLPTPTVESPPTEADETASQPGASSGAATPAPPPATEPAPAPAAAPSAPPTSTASATASPPPGRVSLRSPKPAQAPRVEQRPNRASQRPTSEPVRSGHRKQHRRPSEPTSSSRRPVVETAAPGEPAGLDAGYEGRPSVLVVRSRREPSSSPLLELVCNGAAALFALGAAFAADRRRRRSSTSPAAGAQLLHLPRRPAGHRHVSRAA
jgi:hypothetical protein